MLNCFCHFGDTFVGAFWYVWILELHKLVLTGLVMAIAALIVCDILIPILICICILVWLVSRVG